MTPQNIEIVRNGSFLETRGLVKHSHRELRVAISSEVLLQEVESFLCFVCGYLKQSQAVINPGQTLAYGYWLTKFELADDDVLEAYEYDAEATSFIRGVQLTLTYWRDQHAICSQVGATFSPPRPDRKVAVSVGVIEGDAVEGVRYPSPEHMSGWWVTSDRYDGNPKSLKVMHLYHLTAARPDLACYLALPYGFRFRLRNMEVTDVWFDEKIGQEIQKNSAQDKGLGPH